jgi:pimeloyl-ACP methyl ester carboxylesterase
MFLTRAEREAPERPWLNNGLRLLGLLLIGLSALLMASRAPDVPVNQLVQRYGMPPSDFMEVDGLILHYRDEGPKDDPSPLVLVHGTSASLHAWDGWARALRSQKRVLRLDLPAFGLTGPDPQSRYSEAHYAALVLAWLDALKVSQFQIAGNSLGGEVAWRVAHQAPQRAQKLILVDSMGYAFQPESVPMGFILASLPVAKQLSTALLPRRMVEGSLKSVYGQPERVTAEQVDRYFLLTLREGNRRALVERLEQMKLGESAARIPELKLPTLILWGEQDRLIPPENARHFAKDIAGSQLVMLPGLGHVPHEEDPKASLAPVWGFLGLRPPPSAEAPASAAMPQGASAPLPGSAPGVDASATRPGTVPPAAAPSVPSGPAASTLRGLAPAGP